MKCCCDDYKKGWISMGCKIHGMHARGREVSAIGFAWSRDAIVQIRDRRIKGFEAELAKLRKRYADVEEDDIGEW